MNKKISKETVAFFIESIKSGKLYLEEDASWDYIGNWDGFLDEHHREITFLAEKYVFEDISLNSLKKYTD